MKNKTGLLRNALVKYTAGLAMMMLMLFLPAGSLRFAGGWRLIGLLFVPMLALGVFLFARAPGLLEKRLSAKEKRTTQKGVVAASGLIFAAGFILAGLDFRFGWTHVPPWLLTLASGLLLFAYGLYAEVMRENAWLSRTIEVQSGQRVVDTGLYGVVRHPMYAATILLFLSMPLVLGSWISLAVFMGYPIAIAVRIRNEEELLVHQLAGYDAYIRKVKYRLIPFIW